MPIYEDKKVQQHRQQEQQANTSVNQQDTKEQQDTVQSAPVRQLYASNQHVDKAFERLDGSVSIKSESPLQAYKFDSQKWGDNNNTSNKPPIQRYKHSDTKWGQTETTTPQTPIQRYQHNVEQWESTPNPPTVQKQTQSPTPPQMETTPVVQKQENNTGMPDNLKSGVENLSGLDMSDVKVHYNSDKPAQLQAHAYAQGTDIHLGPGQEKHLPHEAWHVVQQKQGRVKPTMQLKGIGVNDDSGLEKEADEMGGKAMITHQDVIQSKLQANKASNFNFNSNPIQRKLGRINNNEGVIIHKGLTAWQKPTTISENRDPNFTNMNPMIIYGSFKEVYSDLLSLNSKGNAFLSSKAVFFHHKSKGLPQVIMTFESGHSSWDNKTGSKHRKVYDVSGEMISKFQTVSGFILGNLEIGLPDWAKNPLTLGGSLTTPDAIMNVSAKVYGEVAKELNNGIQSIIDKIHSGTETRKGLSKFILEFSKGISSGSFNAILGFNPIEELYNFFDVKDVFAIYDGANEVFGIEEKINSSFKKSEENEPFIYLKIHGNEHDSPTSKNANIRNVAFEVEFIRDSIIQQPENFHTMTNPEGISDEDRRDGGAYIPWFQLIPVGLTVLGRLRNPNYSQDEDGEIRVGGKKLIDLLENLQEALLMVNIRKSNKEDSEPKLQNKLTDEWNIYPDFKKEYPNLYKEKGDKLLKKYFEHCIKEGHDYKIYFDAIKEAEKSKDKWDLPKDEWKLDPEFEANFKKE